MCYYLHRSIRTNSQGIGLVDVRYAEQVITVGGPDADIPGFTSGAIQIALDAIKNKGRRYGYTESGSL